MAAPRLGVAVTAVLGLPPPLFALGRSRPSYAATDGERTAVPATVYGS